MSKPIANHKFRHDTNYVARPTKPKVVRQPTTVKEDLVICTQGLSDINAIAAENVASEINEVAVAETVETGVSLDSPATENAMDNGGLTEEAVNAVSVQDGDDTEINDEVVDTSFIGFSAESTKKELIQYAAENAIEVKDWWSKKKILDALTSQ